MITLFMAAYGLAATAFFTYLIHTAEPDPNEFEQLCDRARMVGGSGLRILNDTQADSTPAVVGLSQRSRRLQPAESAVPEPISNAKRAA